MNNEIFKCFRCGTSAEREEVESPEGVSYCQECGEHAVVSFTTCIDILNDVYVSEPRLLHHILKELGE